MLFERAAGQGAEPAAPRLANHDLGDVVEAGEAQKLARQIGGDELADDRKTDRVCAGALRVAAKACSTAEGRPDS